MGRIKTKMIKRMTNELIEKHEDKLKKTYEENKPIVSSLIVVQSAKLRNIIAGYATRLMKTKN